MVQGQLLFVYNAKSNTVNKAFDSIHKLVSPQTYNCNLCSLTHNNFGERKEWADFKNTVGLEFQFLYSNDFLKHFPSEKTVFPVVFIKSKHKIEALISSSEINSLKNLTELIQLIKIKNTIIKQYEKANKI